MDIKIDDRLFMFYSVVGPTFHSVRGKYPTNVHTLDIYTYTVENLSKLDQPF